MFESYNNGDSKNYTAEISKHGITALWECGGGLTNTGMARIIANAVGNPKKPMAVRTHGDLSCANHALIPIREGDTIVEVTRHWDRLTVDIWRIVEIDGKSVSTVRNTDPIEWKAIEAAIEKSYEYHCRRAVYIA